MYHSVCLEADSTDPSCRLCCALHFENEIQMGPETCHNNTARAEIGGSYSLTILVLAYN